MHVKKGITIILIILFVFLSTTIVSANLTITRNMIGVLGDFDFEFWRESEGEGSSGEANVYKHLLTIGDDTYGEGRHFTEQTKSAFNPVPVIIIAIGILVTGVVVHSCLKKN